MVSEVEFEEIVDDVHDIRGQTQTDNYTNETIYKPDITNPTN